MKFIKKVLKSIQDGTFIEKIKRKVRNKTRYQYIKSNIIMNKQREFKEYEVLKKKYCYVVEKGIKNEKSIKSNKVWIFWLQGIENAPEIVQACIRSAKNRLQDREIIFLNINNYKEYINFPDYIEKKFEEGKIAYAHFADLIRAELLTQYGGLWIDATVLCTGEIPDYILDSQLFVFKNIGLDRSDEETIAASNWLISSWSHNKIIELTRNLLFEYWKKEDYATNYYFFHLLFKIATEQYKEIWDNVPTFNNVTPHILQFELLNEFDEKRFEQIKSMSTIHKLNRRLENNNKQKTTYFDYIIENY